MEFDEAILRRHSVRAFRNERIDDEIKDELQDYVSLLNKEGNLKMVVFFDEPNAFDSLLAKYGKFRNVKNYLALIGESRVDLEQTLGYYGEKFVLKAQTLSLRSCFVGVTYSKRKVPFKLNKNEKLSCVIAFGHGENNGIQHRLRKYEDIDISETIVPEWYRQGIEYVLLAPSAMNQQKYRFEYKNGNVVCYPGRGFFTKMDLGIAKLHFEIGAERKI